jgi:hypothetical protein
MTVFSIRALLKGVWWDKAEIILVQKTKLWTNTAPYTIYINAFKL